MFQLFATDVIATGGKCTAAIVETGGKLPPVSTTLAKLVAKLPPMSLISVANLPPVSLIPVVHLDLQISTRVFVKKIEKVLMGYSGAVGKLIHGKNQKQKSCDTVPSKLLIGPLLLIEVYQDSMFMPRKQSHFGSTFSDKTKRQLKAYCT